MDTKLIDNKSRAQAWYKIVEGYEKENISFDKVVQIMQDEVQKIINKYIDPDAEIEFVVDKEKKEINILSTKVQVIDDEDMDKNPETRFFNIGLSDARKIYPDCNIDDYIKVDVDFLSLKNSKDSKISKVPNIINSSILQAIKTALKTITYNTYVLQIGKTIKAQFLNKAPNGSWSVEFIDGVKAYLPNSLVSSQRKINPGSWHDVVIKSVSEDSSKGNPIIVSMDSPEIIETIIRNNIPEIDQNLIEIVKLERIPGERSKVVFKKNDESLDLDIYGALMGKNSSRISLIIDEINKNNEGEIKEKIDFIIYSDNIIDFITKAMSPAQVIDVVAKNGSNNSYYVIVNKNYLTLAIGKKGSNISLASKITGVNLEVLSVEKAEEMNISFNKQKAKTSINDNKAARKYPSKQESLSKKSTFNKRPNIFSNITANFDSFDADVAAFEEKEKDIFSSSDLENMDFEELFAKHIENYKEEDSIDDKKEIEELLEDNQSKEKEKIDLKDYKKAREVIKNFKVDSDLSNFGLTDDIDLSDIDEDEWK